MRLVLLFPGSLFHCLRPPLGSHGNVISWPVARTEATVTKIPAYLSAPPSCVYSHRAIVITWIPVAWGIYDPLPPSPHHP